MPSNQTPNYQLNQWAKSDQVKMEDFNADNAKIDGLLKAGADARAALSAALGQKAEQTALSALQSTVNGKASQSDVSALQSAVSALQTTVAGKQDSSGALRLAVGKYTGNGSSSRYISLPFTPKAVLVFPRAGNIYSNLYSGFVSGGLAVTGSDAYFQDRTVLAISGSGFRAYLYTSEYWAVWLNQDGKEYHYLALG